MRLKKVGTDRLVTVNIRKTRIDWGKKSKSLIQKEVKDFLFKYWENDIVCEEMRLPGALLYCDFINFTKKILLEVSGEQHIKYNRYFHRGNKMNLWRQIGRDVKKQEWAESNGFKFIEVFEENLPLTKKWLLETYDVRL